MRRTFIVVYIVCIVFLAGCWTSKSQRPNGWEGQINCTGDFSNFGQIDPERQRGGWPSLKLAYFFWQRESPVADKIRLTVYGERVLVQAFKEGSLTREGYFPLTNGQLITRHHSVGPEDQVNDDEFSFTCNERGLIIRRWSSGYIPFMFGTKLSGEELAWYFFPVMK